MAQINIKNLDPAEFNNNLIAYSNLGVGTSPSYDLHVKPSAGNADFVLEKASAASILIQANSTTTKMGSQSNHPLLFLVNNGEKLRVLNSGMVGINETSPTTTNSNILEVKSTANTTTSAIRITNKDTSAGTDQGAALDFGLSRNSGAFKPQAGKIAVGRELDWTSDDANIDAFMSFSVYKNNALVENMRVSSAGVGIKTTNPTAALTVGDGTDNVSIEINKSTSGTATLNFLNAGNSKVYFQADGNEHLRIATNNTQRMSILENGNVGINNTNPGYILTITDGSSSIGFAEYSNGANIWLDGDDGDFSGGNYFNILADGATALRFGFDGAAKMSMLADGTLVLPNLPTSDPGVAGALYRSGTDVKVSTG